MPALLSIDKNHPALAGHFPNNPIIPGVVLIDLVLEEATKQHPELQTIGIKKLKLIQPIKPEQLFNIEFKLPKKGSLRFSCLSGQEVLAEGNLLTQNAS